ncbi:hypothetical protein AArcMg_0668 [Natrarchaeobaculum sulfurireducens]|uniref:Halobacterial output domain-containing protein n=2 Tax=Natrarchaeobaculum sulfurireducens TaxID=2044521 RepID=A0A346PME5_9EURY|nr:hypothetical protein AArcMg_0668 [Natrarchaeobaculum sulfurireducens]
MSQSERVSTEIVNRIGEREEVDPAELPPLGEVIDAAAIDSIADDAAIIAFEYNGYRVRVEHGDVNLYPLNNGELEKPGSEPFAVSDESSGEE